MKLGLRDAPEAQRASSPRARDAVAAPRGPIRLFQPGGFAFSQLVAQIQTRRLRGAQRSNRPGLSGGAYRQLRKPATAPPAVAAGVLASCSRRRASLKAPRARESKMILSFAIRSGVATRAQRTLAAPTFSRYTRGALFPFTTQSRFFTKNHEILKNVLSCGLG